MNKLLSGLIAGVLLTIGILFYLGFIDSEKDGEETGNSVPAVAKKPTAIKRCSAINIDCKIKAGFGNGISGSAKLDTKSHLVVHDFHNGPGEAGEDRLGIVSKTGIGTYTYLPIKVDQDRWIVAGHVASDLESACRLTHSENEFLVAESGRVDQRINGKIKRKPWLGRVFHIKVDISATKPTAEVLNLPKLRLANVSVPKFPKHQSPKGDFPHSKENYEGLACVHLNEGVDEPARYLVVLGERGGESTGTGTLYWGEYDTAQKITDREIKWHTALDVQGIIAPWKGNRLDPHWRDITGLHIDENRRLFATAAYDPGADGPPFEGVMYQLGVVCIDQSDKHGETALCDYTKAPRPVKLTAFSSTASTVYHKFESVAAPSGTSPAPGQISIAAEDEDSGGVWWASVPK